MEVLISSLANNDYAVAENFLDPSEAQSLYSLAMDLYTNGDFKRAGIGNREKLSIEKEIRSDMIFWLEEDPSHPVISLFYNKVNRLKDYLNSTCFLGINSLEFHLAVYAPGSYYQRHLDRFKSDDSRVISVVCYLNQDWKPEYGGELVLYCGDEEKRILPEGGKMVCFRSDILEHEVLPAGRNRVSITGWLKRRNDF